MQILDRLGHFCEQCRTPEQRKIDMSEEKKDGILACRYPVTKSIGNYSVVAIVGGCRLFSLNGDCRDAGAGHFGGRSQDKLTYFKGSICGALCYRSSVVESAFLTFLRKLEYFMPLILTTICCASMRPPKT